MRTTLVLMAALAATAATTAVAYQNASDPSQEAIDAADRALHNAADAVQRAADDPSSLDAAGPALDNAAHAVEEAGREAKSACPVADETLPDTFFTEEAQVKFRSRENHLLHYSAEYPVWIKEEPALEAHVQRAVAAEEARNLTEGRKWYKESQREQMPAEEYQPLYNHASWVTTYRGKRLMGLAKQSMLGPGAHPVFEEETLIWDLGRRGKIDLWGLFSSAPEAKAIVRQAFCPLATAIVKKRNCDMVEDIECPDLPAADHLAITSSSNEKIDQLTVLLGRFRGHAESDYEVDVPITPELLALVKPEYRSEFVPHSEKLRSFGSLLTSLHFSQLR